MKAALTICFLAFLAAPAERVVEGNSKSVVRVIAYEDLQCSDCAVYRKMMDEQLLPKYGAAVAFEHRDFPLTKHKWAKTASIASRYLDSLKPETGVAFRRWVMTNQTSLTPANFEGQLLEWAKSSSVDPALLRAALLDEKLAKLVNDDYEEGVARGVARTPTVFVNGEPFVETFTVGEISKAIDTALAASNK